MKNKFGMIVLMAGLIGFLVVIVNCQTGYREMASEQDTTDAPASEVPSQELGTVIIRKETSRGLTSREFWRAGTVDGLYLNGLNLSLGGNKPVNDKPYDAVFFENYGVNPFIDTEDDTLSTFAMDVDTASYTIARRFLNEGNMPDPSSVRVEEFVNYFDYDYAPPIKEAFAIHVEGAPSRFGGKRYHLMRIGLKGREIAPESRKNVVLTFVIDISGSMRGSRIAMVKQSLRLLVDNLSPLDRVGLVVYGSTAKVYMEPTPISEKSGILAAIDSLATGGSTNAAAGLREGFKMAERNFRERWINRVILCSDGVANVDITGANGILKILEGQIKQGVMLSTIGYGMGHYNDILMEQLGDKGNGHYSYIDSMKEAGNLFGKNLTSTLQVIARDAKIQVEFNNENVARYRLLGYENRDVADKDFRNDHVDGGEVGPGHSVTALYEIKFAKNAPKWGDVCTVRIRYHDADTGTVRELAQKVTREHFVPSFGQTTPSFRLAAGVAEFSEILRKSYWARGSNLDAVIPVLQGVRHGVEDSEKVAELIALVKKAKQLAPGDVQINGIRNDDEHLRE